MMTFEPGMYFPGRDEQPLTEEEAFTVRRFHELSYNRWLSGVGDPLVLSWFGHGLLKSPLDLWMYQELLVRTRPDLVVEAGTYLGGSALFFATLFDLLGQGEVITID